MFDLMSVMRPNKVQVTALPMTRNSTTTLQRDLVLSIFTSVDAYHRLLYLEPHAPTESPYPEHDREITGENLLR